MKNLFKKTSAAPLSEAEQALKSWGIKYKKQPDGSVLVPGDLNISNKGLTELPDLSSVAVTGDFFCHHNQLTSLEHAPHTVGGDFSCDNNQLTSLEHAPHTVGGDFWCNDNRLTSLEHAPHTVTGHFFCNSNQLTSLEYAPHTVGGSFYCNNNQLTSLEHAPTSFQTLTSDLGVFKSWNDVPENLRTSPETKARLQQERLAEDASRQAAMVHAATVLQEEIKVSSPLKLRSRAPA